MNDFYKGITKAPIDYDEQDNFIKRNHQNDTIDNTNDTKTVKDDTVDLKKQLKGFFLIIYTFSININNNININPYPFRIKR